jgi:hypothetical protein
MGFRFISPVSSMFYDHKKIQIKWFDIEKRDAFYRKHLSKEDFDLYQDLLILGAFQSTDRNYFTIQNGMKMIEKYDKTLFHEFRLEYITGVLKKDTFEFSLFDYHLMKSAEKLTKPILIKLSNLENTVLRNDLTENLRNIIKTKKMPRV